MSETPPPPTSQIDKKFLTRILIVGAILGAIGTGIFLLLWIILGNTGMSNFPRLVISVCTPPTLLALLFGIYYLLTLRTSN